MNTNKLCNTTANAILNSDDLLSIIDNTGWLNTLLESRSINDNSLIDDVALPTQSGSSTQQSIKQQSINDPSIMYNPLANYQTMYDTDSTTGVFVDPRVTELEEKIMRLEKYFDKIKKVMPWVPDEDDEFK